MVLEGAMVGYINTCTWMYNEFLDDGLSTPDASNILQENIFIILASVEMTALSRLFSILHYAINVTMCWLADKTHILAKHEWSAKKMATAIDWLHDALVEIEKDGKKILDEEFMLSIFKPLNLKPVDEYMEFIFEIKNNNHEQEQFKQQARSEVSWALHLARALQSYPQGKPSNNRHEFGLGCKY